MKTKHTFCWLWKCCTETWYALEASRTVAVHIVCDSTRCGTELVHWNAREMLCRHILKASHPLWTSYNRLLVGLVNILLIILPHAIVCFCFFSQDYKSNSCSRQMHGSSLLPTTPLHKFAAVDSSLTLNDLSFSERPMRNVSLFQLAFHWACSWCCSSYYPVLSWIVWAATAFGASLAFVTVFEGAFIHTKTGTQFSDILEKSEDK